MSTGAKSLSEREREREIERERERERERESERVCSFPYIRKVPGHPQAQLF